MSAGYQDLWLFLLSLGSAGMGWFLRMLWDTQTKLIRDLNTLEVKLAKEYVPNDRMKDFTESILDRFDRLEDKFDRCFRSHDSPI